MLKRFFSHFYKDINPPHPSYRHLLPPMGRRKKCAFTLAEVLITLGIIGVVAAMTMPSIIANNRKKELHSGLNKSYSVIQQALQMYQKDYGEPITNQNCGYRQLKSKIGKYLNIVIDCGLGTEITACIYNMDMDTDGIRNTKYMTYNKKNSANPHYFDDGEFIISDGMLFLIENASDSGNVFVSVDVNGLKKAPNTWGWDLFTFQLMQDGKLLPMGAEGTIYSEDEFCSLSDTSRYNGIACTNKAMYDVSYWK